MTTRSDTQPHFVDQVAECCIAHAGHAQGLDQCGGEHAGARADRRDDRGKTALDIAREQKHAAAVALLWANIAPGSYTDLWHTEFALRIRGKVPITSSMQAVP